jgi:nicotinamidase-related amidase
VLVPAAGSVLLLVDLQRRLMPAISGGDAVVANADRLARAAQMLDVPVAATEQNPAGLGPTVDDLASHPQATLAKTAFAATSEPAFDSLLPAGTENVVVAGCEAHVCVLQTVIGLCGRGHRVLVVADAVGSRTEANRDAALVRAREHGAEVVTTEMVLFEWLGHSGHPRFRDVQQLIR